MNSILSIVAATTWAASPVWSLRSGPTPSGLGWVIAAAGDVNGDGFDDVVVGEHAATRPLEYQGQVSLFLGSARGLGARPVWTVIGERAIDFLGYEAGSAGDLNGDGFDDVVVGATHCGSEPRVRGCVDVYLGSADGLGQDPEWSFQQDLGSDWYGHGLASAGDVDGDGYDELLVAGPGDHSEAVGGVLLFRGGPAGPASAPDWQAEGKPGDGFGFAVSGAGDVNGDGYADVLVGGLQAGLHAWYGSPEGLSAEPSWTWPADETSRRLGWSVAGAGDLNGDGFDDVVASDPSADTPATRSTPTPRPLDGRPAASSVGRVVVFLGSATGLRPEPDWTIEGATHGARVGKSVAGAGDLDADGFDDLVIGVPGGFGVFLGGRRGPDRSPARWVSKRSGEIDVGEVVGSAGDVDGDGRDELLVGAPAEGDGSAAGRVFAYGIGGRARAARSPPAELFVPSSVGEPAPIHPWEANEVLRDWPYECQGSGMHPAVDGRVVPPERTIAGWHCAVAHSEPTCEEGTSTPVGPDEAPPGAMSPNEAVAAWSAGDVRADWCLGPTDNFLADGPISVATHLDPAESSAWGFIGWSDAPGRHVNRCPWRRVLRVPVVLDLATADGSIAGTVSVWLVVTSDRPETWTLTSRGRSAVDLGAAIDEAWWVSTSRSGIEPTGVVGFGTDGMFGHRQLALWLVAEGVADSPRRQVDGQWRWTPR